jgi:beta-lactam-binding protein with PASTA domain
VGKPLARGILVFLFLALGAGSGYLAYKYLSILRLVEVPDIKGMSLEEAHKELKEEGLKLVIAGRSFDPAVPKGRVLSQSPPAGEKMYQKGEVKIYLSDGPPVGVMPDIRRMTVSEAAPFLARKGLSISKIIKVHSDVEKDIIIGQSPAPMAKMDREVSVIVSAGGHNVIYYTPDFTGMSEEEASGLAEKLGLIPQPQGAGEVIWQEPAPGEKIKRGEEVRLMLGEE